MKGADMGLFSKRQKKEAVAGYDTARLKPAIRSSICTGEKVAGFVDLETKRFREVQLIRGAADLEAFRRQYGIQGEIETIY